MADHGNRAAAYDSLRSILRALDEEDEATPIPDYDGSDGQYPELTPRTEVVCRYERVLAPDPAAGMVSSFEPTRSEAEVSSGRLAIAFSRIRSAVAFVAPTTGLLLVGVLVMLPSPHGQWARAALEELGLQESINESAHRAAVAAQRSADPAGAIAPAERQSPTRAIQAFAEQAQRALSALSPTEVSHELPPVRD